jgi:hypothetical protein
MWTKEMYTEVWWRHFENRKGVGRIILRLALRRWDVMTDLAEVLRVLIYLCNLLCPAQFWVQTVQIPKCEARVGTPQQLFQCSSRSHDI